MTSETLPEKSKTGPLLDRIVNSTLENLLSRTSDPETDEPYTEFHAAEDTIKGVSQDSDMTLVELFKEVIEQTSLMPRDLELSLLLRDLPEAENWDEFFLDITQEIVVAELEKQHPELIEESNKRLWAKS